MAQATKESVTAFQIGLRRLKRESIASKQSLTTPAEGGDVSKPGTPQQAQVEQFVFLQDFPRTFEDFEALVSVGFTKLNCVNLIEEVFNREIDDENDDVDPETDRAQREE